MLNLTFGQQELVALRPGDRVQLRSHFGDVNNIEPPRGLEVVAVAFSGDTHVITYEATEPLLFHTSEMFPDRQFQKYRAELQEFYEYRNRILRGEFHR